MVGRRRACKSARVSPLAASQTSLQACAPPTIARSEQLGGTEWTSSRSATGWSPTTRSSRAASSPSATTGSREVVDRELAEGLLWPESLIQLNPSFRARRDDRRARRRGRPPRREPRDLPAQQERGRGRRGRQRAAPPPPAPGGRDPRRRDRRQLRPDDRHGLGQEPHLHRPDRRPRSCARAPARASGRSSSTR